MPHIYNIKDNSNHYVLNAAVSLALLVKTNYQYKPA